MMGIAPTSPQPNLFTYGLDLEARIPADHDIRQLNSVVDLDFVLPIVRPYYGRSGHVSLDPRAIVKMMLLLFYYNIPSERELMAQIAVRLDFLWFLGFDLESPIPDHSVVSKARARWGKEVFQSLFEQTVQQCVGAGLVDGRLLHTDSTMVKANASKATIVTTSPELVGALRQAYQELEAKLEVMPASAPEKPSACLSTVGGSPSASVPSSASAQNQPAPIEPLTSAGASASAEAVCRPVEIQVLPKAAPDSSQAAAEPAEPSPRDSAKKLPVNQTRISLTDPEAELARSKNGLTDLNYKEHRIVDDAHGVITALSTTGSNVPDGTELPALLEEHRLSTGLELAQVTIAGDHHYGTASNYLFCAQEGIRAHLGDVSANVQERGKLPQTQFTYQPQEDRLRCPQGHYLIFHQSRPEEQLKVYQIEDPAQCAQCPLRAQCTQSKHGRSIRRHVQAELIAALQQEANSPAARQSRKRRQHVMEGSFADAANNHGSKKARWRGLWRQKIQSYLIAAVQNLRILIKKAALSPRKAAALAGAVRPRESWTIDARIEEWGFGGLARPDGTPEGLLISSSGQIRLLGLSVFYCAPIRPI